MYVPIFIVWDETLSESFAHTARQKINEFLNSVLPGVGLAPFLHVTFVHDDGTLSTGRPYYGAPEFGSVHYRFGKSSSADITFNFANLPISSTQQKIEQREDVGTSFSPLIIIILNRPFADVHQPGQALLDLMKQDSSARVIAIGTSHEYAWQSLTEDAKSKEILFSSFSDDSDEVSNAFDEVCQYVRNALKQTAGQSKDSTSIDVSSNPSSPSVLPSSDPERPVIKLTSVNDSSIEPTESATSARPNISFASEDKIELSQPISGTSEKSAEEIDRESTVPQLALPPIPSTELGSLSPAPSVSSQSKSVRSRLDPRRIFQRGTKDEAITYSSSETRDKESDKNESSEQANDLDPVSSSFPTDKITQDGQTIIDHSSSLNAKPWYTPKWKKLPRRGPSRDLEVDLGSLGDLRVIAGSTRGTKHQYYADVNQDAFYIAQSADSTYLVIAVADGVGSAEFSAYGSRFVSVFVSEQLAKLLSNTSNSGVPKLREVLAESIAEASDKMQQWNPDDMYAPPIEPTVDNKNLVSSTLCVAIIPVIADTDGSRLVTIGCVGDSPCYTLNGDRWTLRSEATKDGAVLEHGTYALPSALGQPPLVDVFEFKMDSSDVLVLMTDGIGTSLASGETPVGRWLAPRLYGHQLMTDLIHTLDFVQTLTADRQGEDDDRTLAVVYDFSGVKNAIQSPSVLASLSSETDGGN